MLTNNAVAGETVKATPTAGIAERIGPTTGIISSKAGDQRENIEVRHAEQPKTDGRGCADNRCEHQLTRQPRADLR